MKISQALDDSRTLSAEHTCKNCAKCHKSVKFRINEASNIYVNIQIGSILKTFIPMP